MRSMHLAKPVASQARYCQHSSDWGKHSPCYSREGETVEMSKGNAPVDGLIAYQDRGGLKYPTRELITVLVSLQRFVDVPYYRKATEKPLEASVERAVAI